MSNEATATPETLKLGLAAVNLLGELSLNDVRNIINKTVSADRAMELAQTLDNSFPKGLSVEERLAAAMVVTMVALFDYAVAQTESENTEPSATEPRQESN